MSEQFPTDKYEALALLYIQKKNMENATPEDFVDEYKKARDRIEAHFKATGKKKSSL